MSSKLTNPTELRKQVLSQLKNLDPGKKSQFSTEICARAFSNLKTLPVGKIALYRPLSTEVDLSFLEQSLAQIGAELCYPKIVGENVIEFFHIPNPTNPSFWELGQFGILEPRDVLKPALLTEIRTIVVPGVAFGESGERIGRGKGYYDRVLAKMPDALKVALAFDFQIFSQLEQNAWDQPVDWIMTEERELKLR